MTNSQTKTRGILMSSWSIERYLAGRKNQTRRTKGLDFINEKPEQWKFSGIVEKNNIFVAEFKRKLSEHITETHCARLPYGAVGDTLYFKETFQVWKRTGSVGDEWIGDEVEEYDGRLPKEPDEYGFWNVAYKANDPDQCKWWRPSIFMPKWAARFREIPILNIRVERLLDITELDAMDEGLWNGCSNTGPKDYHRNEYFKVWDSLNGKTMPASKNPWLWVYEFPFHEVK